MKIDICISDNFNNGGTMASYRIITQDKQGELSVERPEHYDTLGQAVRALKALPVGYRAEITYRQGNLWAKLVNEYRGKFGEWMLY